jgi:murein DD-endopeptidase MepM/ murein hydrolase activator NlpD
LRHRSLLLLCIALAACGDAREVVQRIFNQETARERYVARLEAAGLTGTAVARDWMSAANRALHEAPRIRPPHNENGYLAPSEPVALAYRVLVRRGQELRFEMDLESDSTTQLFLEAWELVPDTVRTMRRLEAADSGARALVFRPRRDGEITIVAQAELLRGGRFSARVRVSPTLAFPVERRTESDIGSVFGDPREGGRRRHHGIDIFAPRGTPVIAAAAGDVYRVRTTPVGGNVVWMRDDLGNRLYYAHLDRHHVQSGMRVEIGDTLGFVGNTGNARTTPPHLHFGVYSRGPVDPYWFVHRPRGSLARLVADTALIGTWARTPRVGIVLHQDPDGDAATVRALALHTPVRVLAAVGEWYRVRLPDGSTGYVTARFTEPAARSVRITTLAAAAPFLARPRDMPHLSDVMAHIAAGDSVHVLGEFDGYLLVRANGGREGWLGQ